MKFNCALKTNLLLMNTTACFFSDDFNENFLQQVLHSNVFPECMFLICSFKWDFNDELVPQMSHLNISFSLFSWIEKKCFIKLPFAANWYYFSKGKWKCFYTLNWRECLSPNGEILEQITISIGCLYVVRLVIPLALKGFYL